MDVYSGKYHLSSELLDFFSVPDMEYSISEIRKMLKSKFKFYYSKVPRKDITSDIKNLFNLPSKSNVTLMKLLKSIKLNHLIIDSKNTPGVIYFDNKIPLKVVNNIYL